MGVDEGAGPVVVVIASDFPHAPLESSEAETTAVDAVADRLDDATTIDPADDDALAATDPERVREFFDVDDAELAATDADLAALVRERVVLLSIDH